MQRYYSNTYWHFVGSPLGVDWHSVRQPSDILRGGVRPKEPDACVKVVADILASRTLKARCTERISDQVLTRHFCCVTDIPLKDLPSHAPYYGRVAIGFRAAAIHSAFLPVLYYPTHQLPQVQRGFIGNPVKRWQSDAADRIIPVMAPDPSLATNPFKDYLKLTDFSARPEESFYREREWRHPGSDFRFQPEDIAAIVAPEREIGRLRALVPNALGSDGRVSFVTWELIENS